VQLLLSLRAGVQQGKLFYTFSDYLVEANAQPATLPIYALELRLANKGPWSLITGVHYANMRSEATKLQPAQLGTTNTGEVLRLPFRVEVQSLQAPILLRYTLGHHVPFRPYVAAGPQLGLYRRNQTVLSYTTLTAVGSSTATPYRNDVVTLPVQNPKTPSPTLSGVVRLGLQFKTKSRFSPLLEAQYSIGRDGENNPGLPLNALGLTEQLGRLHYRAFSLLIGAEF
jgi:hypothetical protein